MKVGIIRCMQTEDYCPGTTDFKVIKNKQGAFEGVKEDIEIIGMVSCGGCPGKSLELCRSFCHKKKPCNYLHGFFIRRSLPK